MRGKVGGKAITSEGGGMRGVAHWIQRLHKRWLYHPMRHLSSVWAVWPRVRVKGVLRGRHAEQILLL